MAIATIYWDKDQVKLIDQTRLPVECVYISCRTKEDIWQAIKIMQIRGAPAIGIAAAFGVFLGMNTSTANTYQEFISELEEVTVYLAAVRPTAVNLKWALERMKAVIKKNADQSVDALKKRLFQEAMQILDEDKEMCRQIGKFGSELIKPGISVITHCNAGGLANEDYGTALAVFFRAHEQKVDFHVYVDETRPVLQGSRLTSWELMQAGIDCTLICDNMAASLMRHKKIDLVIVGGDRVARNGDTANKIGTYNLACLANIHKIPFYVAVPSNSFDLEIANGSFIPIEERASNEVTHIKDVTVSPAGIKVYNPAFDVTPADLITGFITERGIIEPPYEKNLVLKLS